MKFKEKQKGATLIMAMIFLILMSLFAISSFKNSIGNLRIVGNMQSRQEVIAAAQMALEKILSSSEFTSNSVGVALTPINIDIDGNGTVDYITTVNPQLHCYRTRAIKSSELNPAVAADRSCMTSGKTQDGGLDFPNVELLAGNSLCANSEWNISAQVFDARSDTKIVINQGVGIRVLETDLANLCTKGKL